MREYVTTLEQEEREIRAILSREFCASLLNNTKWRELLGPLERLSIPYRVKFVDVPMPLEGNLSHRTDKFYDSPWGIIPILAVEWLETIGLTPEIETLISTLNVPYHLMDDGVRVFAHLRNGQPMPPNNSFKPKPLRGSA